MRRTPISVSFEDVFRGSPALRRLQDIVGVDPRFRIQVYHATDNGLTLGWGPIGAEHYYCLMADDSVSPDEVDDIARALKEATAASQLPS